MAFGKMRSLSLGKLSKSPLARSSAVRQTGARSTGIKTKGGQRVFRLGGGLFTEREIVKGRARFGQARGVKITGLGKSALRFK